MGVADNIIAQRQFNEIVSRFNNPSVESVTVYPKTANEACLRMLVQEGFNVREGQWGSHHVSLPKPGGFWANR